MKPLSHEELKELQVRICDAAAWAKSKWGVSDVATALRTPELKPTFLVQKEIGQSVSFSVLVDEVERLCALRRSHLKLARAPASYEKQGKLLVYRPYRSEYDGASQNLSHGYFDGEDYPPWDTWLWASQEAGDKFNPGDVIISWVPPEFFSLVDYGIASCVSALSWVDENWLGRFSLFPARTGLAFSKIF